MTIRPDLAIRQVLALASEKARVDCIGIADADGFDIAQRDQFSEGSIRT
jgi:hypothetical protein